jgi:hypothetical protein
MDTSFVWISSVANSNISRISFYSSNIARSSSEIVKFFLTSFCCLDFDGKLFLIASNSVGVSLRTERIMNNVEFHLVTFRDASFLLKDLSSSATVEEHLLLLTIFLEILSISAVQLSFRCNPSFITSCKL